MSSQLMIISLTPADFAACKQRLISAGVAVPESNTGLLSHEGVTVRCDYNGRDTLTVMVIHRPCLVAEGYVESRIRGWFAEVSARGEAQCQ